ncbi:hypothetical protein [Fructilactobacillus frigidiflavus]|uniref:hypothetical protein n=1 Tax=Fructilactobacillus frigidiflavus TaxID=3242688 RepID=UPI0037580887
MLKFLIMFRNNGPWIICTLLFIGGIHTLIVKDLPVWLFIAVIFSVLFFAFKAVQILYYKFKNKV